MSIEVTVLGELVYADLELDCELVERLACAIPFGDEYELVYDVSIGRPAKIDGPPEKCYPAEGDEIELQSDTLMVACRLLEQVKHLFTVCELYHILIAIEKQISAYAAGDRAQEDAQGKAHEINETPPERDYDE